MNKIIGDKYEQYIKSFLSSNIDNKNVKIRHEVPLDNLIQAGIFKSYQDKRLFNKNIKESEKENGRQDIGCDILYLNKDSKWIIVQCKNHKSPITLSKVAGFFSILNSTKLNGELYYTSSLSKNLKTLIYDDIKFIKKKYENNENNENKLIPRDYQIEAYNEVMKEENKRGDLFLYKSSRFI